MKKKITAAGRRKIAEAQKARWAKLRASKGNAPLENPAPTHINVIGAIRILEAEIAERQELIKRLERFI